MEYVPRDAKPGFDAAGFREMLRDGMGGHMPYAGMLTMFRQPHTQELEGVDVAFVGLPWDGTPLNRSGQRYGPRAMRETSAYVLQEQDYTLFHRLTCVDYGDVFFHTGNMFDFIDQTQKVVEEVLAGGAMTFCMGGDHLIPLPILRAYAKQRGEPVALLHFDAHRDSWDIFPYSYGGSWLEELVNEGCIDAAHSVSMGMREDAWPAKDDVTVIPAANCLDEGPQAIAEQVRAVIGDTPVYITFDIDFLDATVAQACHTASFCGPDMWWTRRFLKALSGLKVIGVDVNELCPHYEVPCGPSGLALTTVSAWLLELIDKGRQTELT